MEKCKLIKLCGSIRGNETAYLTHIVPRRKYTLVNIGNSGRYVLEGERVYGCKAYGVINRRRSYGTLDDIVIHAESGVGFGPTIKTGKNTFIDRITKIVSKPIFDNR